MHAPPDGTRSPDPGGGPPSGPWGCLKLGLFGLGTLFLSLGLPSLLAALAIPGAGLGPWGCLLLPAWALTPLLCSLLLIQAAYGLEKPRGELSTSLVVAAAAAFVGLVWVIVTAVLLFGGGWRW